MRAQRMHTRRSTVRVAALVAVSLFFLTGGGARGQGRREGRPDESILFQSIPSVLGASRFEQLATEAPASVTVLTAQDIDRYGWRTVADIIRSVRGFFVSYDRDYSYVGARGFERPGDYNGRVLLLMDGQRLNENVFDGGYVGTESLVDVDLIDRIEIIRGPSSSLYGTNALLGVINVVTQRGRDASGVRAAGEAGTYGTRAARASWGGRTGGVEALLSGSLYHSDGPDLYYPEFDQPATNNGMAKGLDSDRRAQLFAKATLGDFTLEAAHVTRRKQVPTAAWETVFDDPRMATRDAQGLLSLAFEHTARDQSQLSVALAYHQYDYEGDFPYTEGLLDDWAHGRSWDAELHEMRSLHGLLGRHRLVLGSRVRLNLRQEQGASGAPGEPPAFQDNTHGSVYAIFAQDEWRPLSSVILNAGVRWDHYPTFGGTVNPRIGLLFGSTRSTTLKLLYGTAFRAPNNYELYYYDAVTQKSNPELQPEATATYEAVLERQLSSWARAVTSVYHYELRDLINPTLDPADGLLVFRNVGAVRATGVEMELQASAGGVDGDLSYAWQYARDRATGERLANSPQHLVKLHLARSLPPGHTHAGLEVLAMSSRRTFAGSDVPGAVVSNLNLTSSPLWRGISLQAGLYNLTNTAYADPAAQEHRQQSIPQDGRHVRVALRLAF